MSAVGWEWKVEATGGDVLVVIDEIGRAELVALENGVPGETARINVDIESLIALAHMATEAAHVLFTGEAP